MVLRATPEQLYSADINYARTLSYSAPAPSYDSTQPVQNKDYTFPLIIVLGLVTVISVLGLAFVAAKKK